MSKIAIVGYGFVGAAVADSFVSAEQLYICDTRAAARKKSIYALSDRCSPIICSDVSELPAGLDAVFICVPTPAKAPDGSCDDSILLDVIDQLLETGVTDTVISKSTAPVRSYLGLPDATVAYLPEFLRAAHAMSDYANQEIVTIGSNDVALAERIQRVLLTSTLSHVPQQVISREAAVMAKYAHNVSLAMKVAVMNEIFAVAEFYGVGWDEVCKGLQGTVVANSHINVPGPDGIRGFGGACFPKDVAAFLRDASECSVTPETIANGFLQWSQPASLEGALCHETGFSIPVKQDWQAAS